MINKPRWTLAIIPLLLSCAGCGGGGGGNPTGIVPSDCSINGQNKFVYDVMQNLYLYYDQMPVVNPSDYSSPRALLEDLKVAPDRFSFITDQQTQQSFQAGTYNGIGFSFKDNGDSFTVTSVFNDSSAGRAGLQRSDQIFSIEGVSVSQINNDGSLSDFLNNYDNADPLTFSVSSSGTQAINIEMSKGLVKMNTVLSAEVVTSNTLKIGYLALSSFIEPTKAELATAFNKFNQESIDELVLDLRYNGGGLIETAQRLASYIAGSNAVGADTSKLIYNDKNSDLNESVPFLSLNDSVDLDRLYVLTLEGTCSASELVINAMNPVGIEVVTVGQTTCGKPIGFRQISFCGKNLSPASFTIVNDSNQGNYFDGIAATCDANDEINTLLADPNESMFAAALYHINNGQCQTAARPSLQKSLKAEQKYKKPMNIMESVF